MIAVEHQLPERSDLTDLGAGRIELEGAVEGLELARLGKIALRNSS